MKAILSMLKLVAGISVRMLFDNRARFALTVSGIAVAFFLAAAQCGLLVGWVHTITALINNARADLWVMADQTPAYDYGSAIPRQRIYQARSVPGVRWAEGLFQSWNMWQRTDGARINVELIGLDKGNLGAPWRMREGEVNCVHLPQSVIVDELYMDALGVTRVGESFEMTGERATVGGISEGVRTFTTNPFIFTSIEQAIRYDKRYTAEEITFVLVQCEPGARIETVQEEMRRRIPHVEVLTTREFAARSAAYWMLQTGIGITVIITAILSLVVGGVIISQTLFAITQDHIPNYATLLALGFRQSSLVTMVLLQSALLGVLGIAIGSALFFPATALTGRTPIPLESTALVYWSLVAMALTACFCASMMSLRSIFHIDPVSVFRQ